MSSANTDPPNYEKVVVDSTEPLVLRPPVGAAVFGGSKHRFHPLFLPHVDPRGRRSMLLYFFIFLLFLLTIAGVLMILFMFGLGPLSLAYKQDRLHHHQSICRIRVPLLKIDPIESITADENSLNVTLSSLPSYPQLRILHLLSDGLTVIRTNDHCYIRPMRRDLREAQSNDYVKRLNEGRDLKNSVDGNVVPESWYFDWNSRIVIHNSLIMAWCAGVPVFRLVSQPPPTDYHLRLPGPESAESLESAFQDSIGSDDEKRDQAEVLSSFLPLGPAISLNNEFLRPKSRYARNADAAQNVQIQSAPVHGRSIDLAQMMGKAPGDLPISHYGSNNRQHCSVVDDFLEDFTIPSKSEPDTVNVIRDLVLKCSP